MTISTQHVLQRYLADANKWDQSQEEAAKEFYLWLEAVRDMRDQ
jgi:hypothetical protein